MPAHCAALLFSFTFACADQEQQTLLALLQPLPFVPLVSSPAHTPCSEIQLLSHSITGSSPPSQLLFALLLTTIIRAFTEFSFTFCRSCFVRRCCCGESVAGFGDLSSAGVFVEDIFWRYRKSQPLV